MSEGLPEDPFTMEALVRQAFQDADDEWPQLAQALQEGRPIEIDWTNPKARDELIKYLFSQLAGIKKACSELAGSLTVVIATLGQF